MYFVGDAFSFVDCYGFLCLDDCEMSVTATPIDVR